MEKCKVCGYGDGVCRIYGEEGCAGCADPDYDSVSSEHLPLDHKSSYREGERSRMMREEAEDIAVEM